MATSVSLQNVLALFTSLIQGLREDLSHPVGFLQIGAIGLSYLIAWIFAAQIRKYLEKDIDRVRAHMRFTVSPAHFAIMLRGFLWLLLVWFCRTLFIKSALPTNFLHMALNLIIALLVIRFASFYIKSAFWSRAVYVICLVSVLLRIFKLWRPTVHLLDSMTITMGKLSLSVWGMIEAVVVFIVLWMAAGAANRFFAHWITASTRLTYSDRTLIQRVINAATIVLVILISFKAAGIHLAAIVVTGGALGFAVGIGLQKIGSNMVSGLMLLLRKPIRQGDVVAFEKSFAGATYGWIEKIGLMYVQVATRSGSLLLIPNEIFVTQKIENLSYDNNLLRLEIPVGISYASDLNKALTFAVAAAMSIDRILKTPEPQCIISEFGDSTVNLQLRVWIDDPKNGIANVRNAVLLKVWDSFHSVGIEIAFPQRDLHIKSSIPLKIAGEGPGA